MFFVLRLERSEASSIRQRKLECHLTVGDQYFDVAMIAYHARALQATVCCFPQLLTPELLSPEISLGIAALREEGFEVQIPTGLHDALRREADRLDIH
jgi:hypothetical protein